MTSAGTKRKPCVTCGKTIQTVKAEAKCRGCTKASKPPRLPKHSIDCRECGTTFQPGNRAVDIVYCPPCRDTYLMCGQCGTKDSEFYTHTNGGRYAKCKPCMNAAHATRVSTPCEKCGQPSQGKRCRGCLEAKAKEPCLTEGCDKPTFSYGYCTTHMYYHLKATANVFVHECHVCGQQYKAHRRARGNPTCSRACQAYAMNGIVFSRSKELQPYVTAEPSRRASAQAKLDAAGSGTRGHTIWHVITCYICGTQAHTHWATATTCGHNDCLAQRLKDTRDNNRHVRRQRLRATSTPQARVYRQRIYERDGYRCHICGHKTRPDYHYLHPKYPTLDHLVPLAHGGLHTPENVATCCRSCNCIKSDTGYGDQLALIG